MKRIFCICLILVVFLFVSCEQLDKEENVMHEESPCVEYKIEVDNNNTYNLSKLRYVSMDELSQLVCFKSEITECFMSEASELYGINIVKLHENNHKFYTACRVDNQKLCYIVFKKNENSLLCVDFAWIYDDKQPTRDEFQKVVKLGEPLNYVDFITLDKNMIIFGSASSSISYWISLDEGIAAYVFEEDEITRIEYSENIYDIILDKDKPTNILNNN